MAGFVKQFKIAAAAVACGLIAAGAYTALSPTSAHAQSTSGAPAAHIRTMGPVKLNLNESVLIGLLLPAVRGDYQDAQLELFDSSGKMFADIRVAMGQGGLKGTYFRIYMADGSVRVMDSMGNLVATGVTTDGIVTGLLLPAVRPGGTMVQPLAASAEVFNPEGMRMQYFAFADGVM